MKCVKGGLAIIIKSLHGNEGKVVTCEEYQISPGTDGYNYWRCSSSEPIRVGRNTKQSYFSTRHQTRESWLMPITPPDNEEELLASIPMLLTETE